MPGSRKRVRVAGATRDKVAADMRRMYEKGASIRAIAEKYGRSYGFVHRALSEVDVDVTLRSRRTITPDREPREAAHRLLDEVPVERVPAVVELLRTEADKTASVPRRFRTVGVFAGEPDLGRRAKEIARQEMDGESGKQA